MSTSKNSVSEKFERHDIVELAKQIFVHNPNMSASFAINRAAEFYKVLDEQFYKEENENDRIKRELRVRIDDAHFLIRTLNCLRSYYDTDFVVGNKVVSVNRIETIGDILFVGKRRIIALRGAGKKVMSDIGSYLINHNLSWDINPMDYGYGKP